MCTHRSLSMFIVYSELHGNFGVGNFLELEANQIERMSEPDMVPAVAQPSWRWRWAEQAIAAGGALAKVLIEYRMTGY